MRKSLFTLILTLLIGGMLFTNCKDKSTDSNGADDLSSLSKTWTATKYEYASKADPDTKVDLIQMGMSIQFTINDDGTYTAVVSYGMAGQETETGTLSVADGMMTFDPEDDESYTVDYTLSGNTLTMTDENESYDFDGDEQEEPAVMTLVFQ